MPLASASLLQPARGVVTALADNSIAALEDLMLQGGVDVRHVCLEALRWRGTASAQRPQLRRTGFGPRAALKLCRSRPYGDLANRRVASPRTRCQRGSSTRWFHTGGIFAALSDAAPEVAASASVLPRMTPRSCLSGGTIARLLEGRAHGQATSQSRCSRRPAARGEVAVDRRLGRVVRGRRRVLASPLPELTILGSGQGRRFVRLGLYLRTARR
jgi:hypothetical protein